MIRPFTALCVLLAGASGLYLYSEKHRTTVLDQRISRIVQDTQHIREHTAMLRGEWELLNQPDRLKALAKRFLPELHPMAPVQFVQMAALAQHLPGVPAPVGPPLMVDTPILTPTLASTLAPVQVMARVLAPAAEIDRAADQAADQADSQIETPPGEAAAAHASSSSARAARPAQLAAALPAANLRHAVRLHTVPSLSSAERSALHLAQLRPLPAHMAPASRLAAYEGAPARTLLRTVGAYARPASAEAAWRPVMRSPAGVSTRFGGVGSSLGFSHAALPAPVPTQDGG